MRTIVYRYRDDLYKVVKCFDNEPKNPAVVHDRESDEKTLENIRRASRLIEAYGLCNEWDWFVTLTLDPRKFDRLDLDTFRQRFMRMIRILRRDACTGIDALIVPELHHDAKGWHMHGLIRGLPIEELRPFTLHEKLSPYLISKLKNGQPVYDWPRYRKAFGFVDVEPIGNRDACTRYIKKYITKGLSSTASHLELGKHLYFVTRGLKLPYKWERTQSCHHQPQALPSFLDYVLPASRYDWQYGAAEWYELTPEQVQQAQLSTYYDEFSSSKGQDL